MTDSREAVRVAVLLGLLFGLGGFGSSSAAMVLPMVADEFGVGVGTAAWTISGYLLLLAVCTPLYGRLADVLGLRVPFAVGIGLMVSGALLAAAATSFPMLLVARLLQGAGAAAVPTLGVTLVSLRYEGAARSIALGWLAAMAAALSCAGPLLGGVVEHVVGWRGVMALPVCGVLLVPWIWRAMAGSGSGAGVDVLGALLVMCASGGLVMIVQAPATGAVVAWVGLALVLVGAPLVAWRVRMRPDGFLPRTVVGDRRVVGSALVAGTIPGAWFALLVAVPAALVARGWEAWEVGLLVLPSALVALLVPRVVGPLVHRHGSARALASAAVVATVALGVGAWGVAQGGWPGGVLVGLSVALTTAAFGVGQPAMGAAVGDAVEPEVRGVALGVVTLVFMVGGSTGSASVAGLGEVIGIPAALVLFGALPVLSLLAIVPDLRGGRHIHEAW